MWKDYELIDTGGQEKLERYGTYIFRRPEPKALWKKTLTDSIWNKVHGQYHRSTNGGGKWHYIKPFPPSWNVKWNNLVFLAKPTGFMHMGLFPEQAVQWNFIQAAINKAQKPIKVLNLFAYTGGCTLAASSAGAEVTHVDSSKEVLTWTRENLLLSGLKNTTVRLIPDDAITFVKREISRGKKYDAIILDPPKYGRGLKKEVFKIEDDLTKLVHLCRQLLTPQPLFVIINAYAVSYSSITLHNILSQEMQPFNGSTMCGELGLKQSSNGFILPMSIFSIWSSLPNLI
jgi:23S rRNA (cytosine1962-C5)-methyltransferase